MIDALGYETSQAYPSPVVLLRSARRAVRLRSGARLEPMIQQRWLWVRKSAPFCLPLIVLGAAFKFRADIPVNHDVAWLLVAAGRMISGGTYSADFFEINMPLAIAVYIPPHGLAALLGASLPTATMVWVDLLICQCLVLTIWVSSSRNSASLRPLASPIGLTWLLIGLTLLPGYDFGQRDHLVAVLALPFLVLIASDGAPPALPIRIYATVLAAVGFFLKPHFAGLPLLLLLLRAHRDRSWQPLRSVEAATLLAAGIANALVVVAIYPDWLVCARWAADLYGAYRRNALDEMLSPESVPSFAVASVALAALAAYSRNFRSAAGVFLLASAYAWAVYLLQAKGWRYQFLPAAIFVFPAVPLAWAKCVAGSISLRQLRIAAAVAIAAVTLLLAERSLAATRDAPRLAQLSRSLIARVLGIAKRGDYVYAFTTTIVPVFPTVLVLDLRWASRYGSLWPLAGLAAAESDQPERARELRADYQATLIRAVEDDFRRYRPPVVIVDVREGQFGLPKGFDILGFFRASPEFERIWAGYVKVAVSPEYVVYVRRQDARSDARR